MLLLLLLLLLLFLLPDNHCAGQPSMQDFQQLLTAHTRQQIRLTNPIWLSEFKINERQVSFHAHDDMQLPFAVCNISFYGTESFCACNQQYAPELTHEQTYALHIRVSASAYACSAGAALPAPQRARHVGW
jgi:hypothetical protein